MDKTKKIPNLLITLLLLIFFSSPVWSKEKVVSPETIAGTTKVDAEGLIDAANRIVDLIIVDSRITSDRKQGYIEGSLSLPDVNTTCETLAKIIPKKTSPALFYCNGIKCGRSVNAIKVAQKCGYSTVYWFRGGFEEWQNKGYPFVKD